MNIEERFKEINEDHTWRGFSSCGYGLAKQYLDKLHKNENKKPYGIFTLGKEAHRFYQTKVFPAGKFFEEFEFQTPRGPIILRNFEVMEHEQLVHFQINGIRRWSPIDTMFYFKDTDQILIVDYKTISPWGFKKIEQAKRENRLQANIYAYKYAKMSGIKCPNYMIIYINDVNWMDLKCCISKGDPIMARKTQERLRKVDHETEILADWPKAATCLNTWGYCGKYGDCMKYCLPLFEKHFGRHFKDHNEIRKYIEEVEESLKVTEAALKKAATKKKSTPKKTTKKPSKRLKDKLTQMADRADKGGMEGLI